MAGSGVNKVILIGHLGNAPEMRYTQGGQAVANFRIATNDKWTDKAGQTQDIVVWGKLAELCNQYLTKGRQVFVEGRLQTREWMDKENHKNYTTEIVAQQVTFLGGRDGATAGRGTTAGQPDDFGPPPPELGNGDSSGAGLNAGGAQAVDDIPF
jgi:single-strand DNA-binding protein